MNLKEGIKIVIGLKRLIFAFCPKCNSDAPEFYDCTVCRRGKVKKREDLWDNFLNDLL